MRRSALNDSPFLYQVYWGKPFAEAPRSVHAGLSCHTANRTFIDTDTQQETAMTEPAKMIAVLCFAAMQAVAVESAWSQACPEKNIQYWQAFVAGGESDLSARHQQLV